MAQVKAREFFGKVTQGRLPSDVSASIQGLLRRMEGKRLQVSIHEVKRQRSGNQNRYYWGVVIAHVVDMFSDAGSHISAEQVHEFLKQHVGNLQTTIITPNGEVVHIVGSTADLEPQPFERYLLAIRVWAAEFGVAIPLPNETSYGYELKSG